jgi:uncharacterized SAM-binding protein YcdF (DUF218 family)
MQESTQIIAGNQIPSDSGVTRSALKRIFLVLSLASQMIEYVILTQVRYESQGLMPIYFKVGTIGDFLSIALNILTIAFILIAILKADRISQSATKLLVIVSFGFLWLLLGFRHISNEEFSPGSAIALLGIMFLLPALVMTRYKEFFSHIRWSLRVLRNTFALSLLFISIAFFYSFFFPTYSKLAEIANFHADAAVILGAAVWHGNGLGERPSPTLRERIDLGNELLTEHAVPRLIVTGGAASGKQAEGEIAKLELLQLGADPSKIVEETSSHSTLEQVLFLRNELFKTYGWTRFVIVSDEYHLARVCDMCRFNGLTVIGTPSHIHEPIIDLAYYRLRESVALLEYWMLGR